MMDYKDIIDMLCAPPEGTQEVVINCCKVIIDLDKRVHQLEKETTFWKEQCIDIKKQFDNNALLTNQIINALMKYFRVRVTRTRERHSEIKIKKNKMGE